MNAFAASVVLLAVGIWAAGPLVETAAVVRLFDRDRNEFRVKEAMRETLADIVARFQVLTDSEAEDEEHPLLEGLRREYAGYDLRIRDISSGINLNFLPEADLCEAGLSGFLFRAGDTGAFLAFRRERGFVRDPAAWGPFLTEAGRQAVVVYGWLPEMHHGSEAGEMLAAAFGPAGGEGLYPLENGLAPINVNTAYPGVVGALLSRRAWRIPAERVERVIDRAAGGVMSGGELRALVGLPEGHEVYRYLGVRTAFWGVSFTRGIYRMEAVLGAIPERGGGTIVEYRLMEGRIGRE
jgi:hypothetical protein